MLKRLMLVLASSTAFVSTAGAREIDWHARLSDEEAVRKLTEVVLADNLYPRARQGDCLTFTVEFVTATAISVAIRERHEPPCKGDSTTVLDTFSISRWDGAISRYDAITDQFVRYEKPSQEQSAETPN